MQQAFVVLARNRIFRLCQIEGDRAVFDDNRGTRADQKVGEHLAERGWGHVVRIIHAVGAIVSDRGTEKLVGFHRRGTV